MLSLMTYLNRDGRMRSRLDWDGDSGPQRRYFTAEKSLSMHLISLSMEIDKLMEEENGTHNT